MENRLSSKQPGSTDSQAPPLDQIGDILFEAARENTTLESASWATERIERILHRLKTVRPGKREFIVVVPWIKEFTAFTAPGKYIFISRSLFQECSNDDAVAMIIAHEIGHHDLGHVDVFPGWLNKLTSFDMKVLMLALYRVVETRIYGPEQECDADRYALDLCLSAGFDGEKCIDLFNKLEKISLDLGDISGVHGLGDIVDDSDDEVTWRTKLKTWLYQRSRGYLTIRERKERLLAQLRASAEPPSNAA